MSVRLNDQKVLTSFCEDFQEEQEKIKLEEEEIPEDKNYEKNNPQHSRSSLYNPDIPSDQ